MPRAAIVLRLLIQLTIVIVSSAAIGAMVRSPTLFAAAPHNASRDQNFVDPVLGTGHAFYCTVDSTNSCPHTQSLSVAMHEVLQKLIGSLRPGTRSRAVSITAPVDGASSPSPQDRDVAPTSVTSIATGTLSPPRLLEPATSPSPGCAYATPPTPPSALATTGSVAYELLKTAQEASDMFLPLKASIVLVLKVWDVCEVR